MISNKGTRIEFETGNARIKTTKLNFSLKPFILLTIVALLQACTAVSTYPTIARPGDTVSVMVGGSDQAHKNTMSASLTDSNGVIWDLQALGNIRSVFNLRPDGRAYGQHYSNFLSISEPWKKGHEPVQTVMIFDIPNSASIGTATLNFDLNVSDESSGVVQPATVSMEIVDIPGLPGASDNFLRQHFDSSTPAVNFADLEPAPHAKISFGKARFSATSGKMGAAEIVIDFDETIVNGDDINVYVAGATTQRGTLTTTAPFGENQRMVYWKQDGSQLFITVISPTGIDGKFLQIYVVHPRGLAGDPNLYLVSTTGYDINGNVIIATPQFNYYP